MPRATTTAERTRSLRGLEGKNVLVTGGSSGIGQAIAVRFAEYGTNVAINYLTTAEEGEETEEQVQGLRRQGPAGGGPRRARPGRRGVSAMTTSRRWSATRSSSSAASTCSSTMPGSRSPARRRSCPAMILDKVLAVNLRGSFLCAREAIRHFLGDDKPGVIINVSSVHQLIPKPNYLGYSTSKGAELTCTLALEYADRSIRVNGVGPAATVTPINRAWIDDLEKRQAVEEHILMKRAGDADEMAGVTAFLASDDAAYITGQTVFVDGGLDCSRASRPLGRRSEMTTVAPTGPLGGRRPSGPTTSSGC